MLDFLRIKKSYIFEITKKGIQVGQGRVRVWFFVSAKEAHEVAESLIKDYGGSYVSNFSRVY